MAHLVKPLTLGLGSGHDPGFVGLNPVYPAGSLLESLSPSLSLCASPCLPKCTHMLSLSQINE